eukprot:COSAG06_NODE_401_length_16198_cov_469.489596_16_plen_347_part_00
MELSVEQKRQLYHDGFLRLRQAVPQHLVREARRQININRSGGDNMEAAQSAVAAMFNESDIKPLLESGFGTEVPLQKGGQMAVLNPSLVTDSVSESGYPLSDIPYYQWQGHLDGLWNGSKGSLQSADEDDTDWFGPKGTNGVDFCLDADSTYEERSQGKVNGTLTISGFSCLVGIAVSEQMNDGDGQVGLLKGAHHSIEKHFQYQRDQGGPLGPDGPGWPRIDRDSPNAHGIRMYPQAIREEMEALGGFEITPDGKRWPKPELVKMEAGDAVLVMHACPHGGSHVAGPDPRMQCYFRITTEQRAADRHAALCDHWADWHGMTQVVAEERAKAAASSEVGQQQAAKL